MKKTLRHFLALTGLLFMIVAGAPAAHAQDFPRDSLNNAPAKAAVR